MYWRLLKRCMGMATQGNSLYVSSLYQLWRFENVLRPGEIRGNDDRIYVPRTGYVTGDIDIHDIGFGHRGRPIFVSAMYSCLATVSAKIASSRSGSRRSSANLRPKTAAISTGWLSARVGRVRHDGGGDGHCRRLARALPRRRCRDGRGEQRGGVAGPVDAAFAPLVPRSAMAAQFRQRRVRLCRSRRRL